MPCHEAPPLTLPSPQDEERVAEGPMAGSAIIEFQGGEFMVAPTVFVRALGP